MGGCLFLKTIIELKDTKLIEIGTEQHIYDNDCSGSYHERYIISTISFGFEDGSYFEATLSKIDLARFLDFFYQKDFSRTTKYEFLCEFICQPYVIDRRWISYLKHYTILNCFYRHENSINTEYDIFYLSGTSDVVYATTMSTLDFNKFQHGYNMETNTEIFNLYAKDARKVGVRQ